MREDKTPPRAPTPITGNRMDPYIEQALDDYTLTIGNRLTMAGEVAALLVIAGRLHRLEDTLNELLRLLSRQERQR